MAEPDPFTEIPSSFYAAVFEQTRRTDIKLPDQRDMDTLGMVSALYLYTNPPPNGTGTPAPKVAETVLRAINFNRKTEDKEAVIDGYVIDNPVWTKQNGFPFDEISSNFCPGSLHRMCCAFLQENFVAIRKTAEDVIGKMCVLNSDTLTKGRQTWDAFEERSVPCPQAYINVNKLFKDNGLPDHHTVMELIQGFFRLMSMPEVVGHEAEYYYAEKMKYVDGQLITTKIRKKRVVKVTWKGEQVYRKIMDAGRSFCSYLKHGERAHLNRRAIASTGIFQRALFLVLEEFHLALGKVIRGSTISIGGELKKIKISSITSECKGDLNAVHALQATQDATKWNECLSAMSFGMLTKTLFDKEVRFEQRLLIPTPYEELLREIGMASHWLLATKMITLGDGLQCHTPHTHGTVQFDADKVHQFNTQTQSWLKEAIPLRYGNNYIRAPGGMLMGMMNALSTTYGLVNVGWNKPMLGNIYTLRSSDDSMTIYTGPDMDVIKTLVIGEKINLKMCGINLSDKKTQYFRLGVGEYTSWYQDGVLVSQYGAEATRIRPMGINPPDDFYNVAKSTSVSLMNIESNHLGAEAKIRIGITNVRSLYRVNKRGDVEGGIRKEIRVLADGGCNPWNSTNCHLEETSLKERFAVQDNEVEYFLKIRNPDNPFTGEPTEEVMWDRNTGCLTVERVDTPRTIFHYIKRANATISNVRTPNHSHVEKDNARALGILTTADPTMHLRTAGSSHNMLSHVSGIFQTAASGLEWSENERKLIEQAIAVLTTGKAHDDDDMEEIQLDDDL
uniref:RNA-directed RNA polymerase catalytic subunit n=1 Tax=Palmetto orthomyxo-like virus TaxID=2894005 RepID=A0A8K1TTD3_9ORTO|nr:MAG: polymerase PB1 [Palmetto orthomyxo-like virus]